jgi:hypothetical protein
VTTISLVDIEKIVNVNVRVRAETGSCQQLPTAAPQTLCLAAGKPFGLRSRRPACRVVACEHELAAWRAGIGGGDRGLDAELVLEELLAGEVL